ncbi:PH domain-containing protein [Actinoallomurus purpureus]|uniref:PH domain-containing protein n=1 Tax=Actinoallomurus purpureus TaxID=478114 RepID=UPI0020939CC7|nr:PH domain-containing protein [Actinoallomurus purpureus]MCO6004782.1 PH domain-containing protein [Actinoallomurus purpureus]
MGLAKSALGEDEEIVLEFHPHWSTLVGTIFWAVVTVAVAAVAIVFIPGGSAQTVIRLIVAAVAVVVVLVVGLIPFLRWVTTSYTLTNRRFAMRDGILSRSHRDIPLTRVNDVSFRQTLIQRIMSSGTLTVESGGEHGQLVLKNIPRVEYTQNQLYRIVEELTDGDDVRP